jgi:hypothetical protein
MADKRNWLAEYEKGSTQIAIALSNKRDVRTIKKGIEEAQRELDIRAARTELLKEALRKHQNNLVKELDNILSNLKTPPENFIVLSWYHGEDSIFNPPDYQNPQQKNDELKIKKLENTVRRLLKQHLKSDPLWKALTQWNNAYTLHKNALMSLQIRLVNLLKEETGFKLVDKESSPPYVYSYTTGELFLKAILQYTFGKRDKYIDLENNIKSDTRTGSVIYRSSALAEAPGNEDKIRNGLLCALKKAKTLPELSSIPYTYKALNDSTAKAGDIIEEIKLLGLIPGQCDICRRLGM